MTYRESREDFWFQQLSLSLSWCSAKARGGGGCALNYAKEEKVLLMMFVSSYFNEVFF